MTDTESRFKVSPDVERAIRVDEQRRLARRFHDVARRDPRLTDTTSRMVVHWVASMIDHWAPPIPDEGAVRDGTKWAPLNHPVHEFDGRRFDA